MTSNAETSLARPGSPHGGAQTESGPFTDIGWRSLKHHGEELCGDQVRLCRRDDGGLVLVLADGLGSGVKAGILSTLTATIISTMLARAMSLEECVSTMADTLPVCGVRGIAYSTFTILALAPSGEAELIQYDNPGAVLLRHGKNLELPQIESTVGDKLVRRSHFFLDEGDALVLFSDGVPHAGLGEVFNYDWQRDDIIDFLEHHSLAARGADALAGLLLEECNRLYGGRPGDDATVCVVRRRPRCQVNVAVGPPRNPADDEKMMSAFFSRPGRHVVCGGTTADIAARWLGEQVEAEQGPTEPGVPPASALRGADLVTEGAITLRLALEQGQRFLEGGIGYYDWKYRKNPASQLAQLLFDESTDISFFVGSAINQAHTAADLDEGLSRKMRLVRELAEQLRQTGRQVAVRRF